MLRQERRFRGVLGYGLGTGAVFLSATLVTLLSLTTQIRPEPWYDPRYSIPLLGMVLGNTMTGVALGLQTLTHDAAAWRSRIEAQLALGADINTAMRPVMRQALRTAMMPLINGVAATGLVSLPGMRTGQILAGANPLQAVKDQALVMFLIAGATGLGSLTAVVIGTYSLSDHRDRLRLDGLREALTGHRSRL